MPHAKWKVTVVTISMILMNSSLYAMDPRGKGLYPPLNVAGEEEQSLLPQPPYYQVTPQYFPGAVYPTNPPPPYEPKTITAKEHKATIQSLIEQLEEKQKTLQSSSTRQLFEINNLRKDRGITLSKFGGSAFCYFLAHAGLSVAELATSSPDTVINNLEFGSTFICTATSVVYLWFALNSLLKAMMS